MGSWLRLGLALGWVATASAQPGPVQPRPLSYAERERAMETAEMRRAIAAVNVGGTAALVLARAAAEGSLSDVGDGAQALGWGAVAGAGFYGSKRLSGHHPALAIGVAVLAGSLAENAATGDGPLSHLRVPLGLGDVRVRTPFARSADGPRAATEVDAFAVVASVVFPLRGGRLRLRRGVPVYEFDDLGGRPGYRRAGRTVGRVVRVWTGAPPRVLPHETIHRIQALQATALTPAGTVGALAPSARPSAADGALTVDARAEWFYALNGVFWTVFVDYLDGWPEIEARVLDEPPRR